MAIGPQNVGDQRGALTPFHKQVARALEAQVDDQLHRHTPGEPFRTTLNAPDVEPIAAYLVERYRTAGWPRVRADVDGADRFTLVLES